MKRIFLAIAIVAMSCMSCKNSSLGIIDWSSFGPDRKIAMVREYWDGWSSETGVTHNHHDFSWIWNGDKLVQIACPTSMGYKFVYDDQNRISKIEYYDGPTNYNGNDGFHYDGSKLVSVDEYTITYSGNKIKTIVDEHSNTYSYTWKGGNVTKIEVENSKWGNTHVYEYKYDSKNNPFYGCFHEGFSPVDPFHQTFSNNNYTQEIAYEITGDKTKGTYIDYGKVM